MKVEIEAKFLDIDVEKIRENLKKIGAVQKNPERLMKRKNFDFSDFRLEKNGGWVRVRDEGDKITLSYKQLNERSLHGTKEVVVEIDNFDNACLFLQAIGLKNYSYQETKRESWDFDGTEIEIDTWPWVPSFVEIEGKSEEDVRLVTTKLGLDWQKALFGSVEIVYQSYYNVTEEEVDSWEEMRLGPVPEWLEGKRKT
ncbi:MAG: class IV adenylate cyclase [Patescibacteria group bacterium]